MHEPDIKEIEKELDENFGLVLTSHNLKGEMSPWGQVDESLEMGTLPNKLFLKVSRK